MRKWTLRVKGTKWMRFAGVAIRVIIADADSSMRRIVGWQGCVLRA